MASGRMLKKEISNSIKLGRVKTDRARVLYFMMMPHLDVAGRLEACVRRIKGQITTMLPYTEQAIQSSLEELHKVGLIVLYANNGNQYLEYARFCDFQRLNPEREAKTTIPAPTLDNTGVIQTNRLKLNLSKDKISEVKDKVKHLDFVFLSDNEFQKLVKRFGEKLTKEKISILNNGIGSKGYKYKSHYHTILSWHSNEVNDKTETFGAKAKREAQEATDRSFETAKKLIDKGLV